MFRKKAKKPPILYKKFQEDKLRKDLYQRQKTEESSSKSEKPSYNQPNETKKTKETVKDKVTYLKMDLYSKITVAITNINSSVNGSQSVSLLIANYFTKLNKKVCIVTKEPKKITFRGVDVLDNDQLYKSYNEYQVIMYEYGDYDSLDEAELNELMKCIVKIMITQYDIEMMEDMARFIMSRTDIKGWTFYFMYVPDKLLNDVDALMEDYTYYVLPLFSPYEIEKRVIKIIKDTFHLYEVRGLGGM